MDFFLSGVFICFFVVTQTHGYLYIRDHDILPVAVAVVTRSLTMESLSIASFPVSDPRLNHDPI